MWFSIFGVTGPYSFEDEAGRAVTVNSALHWDASHISETEVAEIWCWKSDSLVTARRGNGSHCEDCNASIQRDVSSSRDLTKREYWIACKIVPSQRLWLLPLGIAQEQGVRKEPGTTVDLKKTLGRKWKKFLPPCSNERCRTSRKACEKGWQQGKAPRRHYTQEVNIVIKKLREFITKIKIFNFSSKFT